MKKLFILLFAVVLIAGCGKSNKVVCSGNVEEAGQKYEMKVTGYLENDKIKTIDAEMIFGDDEAAKTMCGLMNLVNGFAEKEEDKIDIKCDGKKMTIKGFEKYDASEESETEFMNMTKEKFIEYFQNQQDSNLVCK